MKKKILALLLILILLSNNVFAISDSYNIEIELEDYIDKLFPKGFFENTSFSKTMDKYNIKPEFFSQLQNFHNNYVENTKASIDNYFYTRNLDNFPDEPIYLFDSFLNVDEYIIPIEDDNEFISNYYNKNYIKVSLKDEYINIQGINTNSHTWSLIFYDQNGEEIKLSYLTTMRIGNNRFSKNFKFYNLENISSFTITLNTHELNKYYPSVYNFYLDKENDKLNFINPETYENNQYIYYESYNIPKEEFLSLDYLSDKEKDTMKEVAENITKGLETDYEKLLAIHKWVSNSIYYDFDSIKYDNRGPNDAYNTYMDKRAICQGYAELSLALSRSVGIPTKLVYGYALGVVSGEDNWNETSLNSPSNHAWNEAYTDGRWVIFDTTWDSSNKYEEEKFIEKKGSLRYFDPSLKAFSQTHKLIEIVDM